MGLCVEEEYNQQLIQPAISEAASATSVAKVGIHVQRNHDNNINEYEIVLCVLYSLELL